MPPDLSRLSRCFSDMSESNLSGAVGEEEPAAEESVAERVAQVKAFQRAAKGFLGGESRLKGLEERRHKLFMAGPKASQSCLTAAIQEDRVRFPGPYRNDLALSRWGRLCAPLVFMDTMVASNFHICSRS